MGLAEVRLPDFGEKLIDKKHRFWCSGEGATQENDVGILISKEVVRFVLSCTPVSGRGLQLLEFTQRNHHTLLGQYPPFPQGN